MSYTFYYEGPKHTMAGTTGYYITSPTYGSVSGADIWHLPWLAYNQLYTKDGDVRPVSIPAAKPTVSFEDLYGGQNDTV